ncbi:hypothetical protein B0H19DRAFT_1199411 [Mycena capillaripes]|nr:hypothetical protein B0H19DRAFT_1199411 [Mycena capillaripes]
MPSRTATRRPSAATVLLPTISTQTDLCTALDAFGSRCNATPKNTSQYCPRHNAERIKLYINYKIHHSSLDKFPEDSICHSAAEINGCRSLKTVRAWNKSLVVKYRLLNRCISAREYFTKRFFGCDFGHRKFWDFLVDQLYKTESLLAAVEQRAYSLLLEAQNALWVLDLQRKPPASRRDCSGHKDVPFSPRRDPPPSPTNTDEIEDPLDIALRDKCSLLSGKIKTRLARYCTPVSSKQYNERIKVIHACVRRAVYTDAKLLVIAQNYKTVVALLTDSTLDVRIVETLWNAIRHLGMHEVRAAIDDVLRPKKDPGEYAFVLGGRVYKDLSNRSFPFRAWGHMTAVFMCYTCARRVCKTVEEVVMLTRFVILHLGGLNQSNLRYEIPYEGSKVLGVCGFLPNSIGRFPRRPVVSKCNCNCVHSGLPHWVETGITYVLCAGLPLSDAKSQAFVNACLRDPKLMVLVRMGEHGRIIRSPARIWSRRVRCASTRAGLQTAAWDPARTVYYSDTVLDEARPLVYDKAMLEECFQLVLFDSGDGSMEDFVAHVTRIWLETVYRVPDVARLIDEVAAPFIGSGELEIVSHADRPPKLMPNLEEDVLKAYKGLWGTVPAELPEDDIPESKTRRQTRA